MQSGIIEEINKVLFERFDYAVIDKHLVNTDKRTGLKSINRNCFDAVVCKNGWKSSNNKYHHKNENPELHYYSHELVDEFIKKVMMNEKYLANAKKTYNANKRKK